MRLLVQLFGQDVVDRLASAGYDSGPAIAQAGPERLSTEASVPLPLARRIVAVAMEAVEGFEEATKPPRPARPRRPAKKPGPRSEAAAPKGTGEASDDSDPFVDEVGLVSWMGFSAKHGASGTVPFSVADGILDQPGAAVESRSGGTPALASGNARPAEKPDAAALVGTLWSFGAEPRKRQEDQPAAVKREDRPAGSPASPRRRFYDDQ